MRGGGRVPAVLEQLVEDLALVAPRDDSWQCQTTAPSSMMREVTGGSPQTLQQWTDFFGTSEPLQADRAPVTKEDIGSPPSVATISSG